ncbi:MAG: hypothetical protein IT428_29135 [Planctomycetaceae bacterium]|nr:hypothetical protein [Planctomycetaceae bacterium]
MTDPNRHLKPRLVERDEAKAKADPVLMLIDHVLLSVLKTDNARRGFLSRLRREIDKRRYEKCGVVGKNQPRPKSCN